MERRELGPHRLDRVRELGDGSRLILLAHRREQVNIILLIWVVVKLWSVFGSLL